MAYGAEGSGTASPTFSEAGEPATAAVVVRLSPAGTPPPSTAARHRALAAAAGTLGHSVRGEDGVWSGDDRLALCIRGDTVTTEAAARRLARRLSTEVRRSVGRSAPFDVVIAVAWDVTGAPPRELERRAAAAAEAGATDAVVVVNHWLALPASDGRPPGHISRQPAPGAATTPFVGRAAELATLHAILDDARSGKAQLAIVHGEAGIGKTALLRTFAAQAGPVTVLWACGDAEERALPFGLLGQLAARAPGQARDDLRALVGGLTPGSDPFLVGAGLLDSLTAADETVVLIVDDAHLADRQSLTALRFVARRLAGEPVLVVLAVRDNQPDAEPPAWLSQLASTSVLVPGLDAGALMALAAAAGTGPLTPAGAGRLFEHTRGHPLYARLLLDQLPGAAFEPGEAPLPAPASLAGTIVSRLASCDPGTRDLVAAAAVLGERCEVAVLEGVAGLPETQAAVSEAVEARLLDVGAGGHGAQAAFTHPLVRAAVYHDLDAARRRRLHARAAELLPPDAGLEHRVAAAVAPNEALAGDLERAAAAEARLGRLDREASWRWRAFEASPPGPSRDRRFLTALEARLVVGEAAIEPAVEDRLAGLPRDPWVDYVSGCLALVQGRIGAALDRLEIARAALGETGPPPGAPADLAARVAVLLATIATLRIDQADMVRYGEAAARHEPDNAAIADVAWTSRTLGLGMSGHAAGELAAMDELDRDGAPPGLDALAVRGILRLWTDDLAGAHADLASAVAAASRGGLLMRPSLALGGLGATAYRMGRLEEASLYGELAVSSAEETGRGWGLVFFHTWACSARAARGDWAEADAHVEGAAQWAALAGPGRPSPAVAAARAAVADARGDAAAFLAAAIDLDAARDVVEPAVHACGPVLADALARAGRYAEAEAALADFEQRTAGLGRLSAEMLSARVRGQIAAARAGWDAAAPAFARALELASALSMPLEEARVHLAAGVAAIAAGHRQRAPHHLLRALDGFDALGADAYSDQAVRAIEASGVAVRRHDRSPVGQLTATEAAVARLVASGLTNREVAARLFVSVKAVEYHLTNLYGKLGVTSRRALAAMLRPGRTAPRSSIPQD